MPWEPLKRLVDFARNISIYTGVRGFACPCYLPQLGSSQDNVEFGRKAARCRAAHRRRAAFSKEARHGSRYSQVFQFTKGLWLHSADRWRTGRVRAYLRGRARRNDRSPRGAEAQLRRRERARQAGGLEPSERLIALQTE